MGHKGRILAPITDAIGSLLAKGARIADPFCGSGIVSWHLASTFRSAVWAGDLQRFACARAAAVLERRGEAKESEYFAWHMKADQTFENLSQLINGAGVPLPNSWTISDAEAIVFEHRRTAEELSVALHCKGPVVAFAYGGHYFSLPQSLKIDALRRALPSRGGARLVGLCALIGATSKCAASPGHTAQPFQPTEGASRWLLDAWKRDPAKYVKSEWDEVLGFEAKVPGKVFHTDAASLLGKLCEGDVAFLDPPYSGVHYSRFYHVLETLTDGKFVQVEGRGRYPAQGKRPASSFSRRGESHAAIGSLLDVAMRKKLRLVMTFPFALQSNGLAAEVIEQMAKERFGRVIVREAISNFSSLGGRGSDRAARKPAREAIIIAY